MIAVENNPKVTVFSGRPNLDRQLEKDEAELKALIEQAMAQENQAEEDVIEVDVSDIVDEPEVKEVKVETQEETPPKEKKESGDVFEKRYKDAQRYINKLKEEIKELKDKKAEPAAEFAPPKSREELEAWMKRYPDVAGFIKALAIEQYASTKTEIEELRKMKEEIKMSKAEQELMKLHPDYQDIRDSDEFHTWAGEQPQWIQQSLYENVDDVKSVARIIDLFKVETGKVAVRRDPDELDAAKTVKARKSVVAAKSDPEGPLFSESQVARMSDAEYAANEEKINEAIRLGRFKYDISLRRA